MAAGIPFQKITRFPTLENAEWIKLGIVSNQSATSFIYSNVTYANVTPSIYAVCAFSYEGESFIDCKLIAGNNGGIYENNIKYKFENNALHIWVRGSMAYPSTLIVLTGSMSIDGKRGNPPSDAIQPSF